MAEIHLKLIVDLDELPPFSYDVVAKTIAIKAATGQLLDSNFTLPITQVGPYKIESGTIRRAW
jgi:hypothetical protein